MDPALAGAWIGLGGGIAGSLLGAAAGYELSSRSERRSARSAAAGHLPELTALLYPPHTLVEVRTKVDQLSISLIGSGVDPSAIAALGRVAELCSRSGADFAQANPGHPPAVDAHGLDCYRRLVTALAAELLRVGRRSKRRAATAAAVASIPE